jgi:RNA polymerase sigma-70 factor (ECF subfamily)
MRTDPTDPPPPGARTGVEPRAVVPGSDGGAAADPDVALMLRVQAGDPEAFPELFRRLAPRVLQFARRLVGSEARAEEVTQDVFVQIFRFRDRYQPQSRLTTWVFTIATNLCLNELRRPERQLRVDLWADERPEGPPLPDPAARTPEENVASLELAGRLEEAIGALSAKQRAALLLSRVDGLAYEDVAHVLGCSEGAVKALIFRATQSLKRTLREFL